MQKPSTFALIAALSVGVAVWGETAQAAPIAPDRVAQVGRQMLQQANFIYAEAYTVGKLADENSRLAREGHTKAEQLRYRAGIIARDAHFLIRDDGAWRAHQLCHAGHVEFARHGELVQAANHNKHWALHYENLAAQHQAEAARLRGMANSETDHVARARLNEAASEIDAAVARDRRDAARYAAAERSEHADAERLRVDAAAKETAANRLHPGSCKLD